jgi:hypothetical protein
VAKRHEFTATIQAGRGGGAFVEVPFDVEATFGNKRPQVKATIQGESFVTSLIQMGRPCHLLGVPKAVRVKLGKDCGDSIRISLVPDHTPREIVVPPDLDELFQKDPATRSFFESLSYTNRKEYVVWITEAKRPETRAARVEKTVALLREGKRTR